MRLDALSEAAELRCGRHEAQLAPKVTLSKNKNARFFFLCCRRTRRFAASNRSYAPPSPAPPHPTRCAVWCRRRLRKCGVAGGFLSVVGGRNCKI